MTKLLEVDNLAAGYDQIRVLWDVSFSVMDGECVALLGPNGAGKTTVLRSIAGLVRPSAGTIRWMGSPLDGLPAHEISRRGIRFVSEDSNLFLAMTVEENLLLGGYGLRPHDAISRSLEYVFSLFPILHDRRRQLAGTLSGGERKMLGLGRGLMGMPRILLVDEPSLGLAPRMIATVFQALRSLNRTGMTILLVEQNVAVVLEAANRCCVLERGRVVLEGESTELKGNAHIRRSYLGLS